MHMHMPIFAASTYQIMANAILILHTVIVLFVIGGLLATLIGGLLHWTWTRNLPFRAAHLGAILFVVFESWAGIVCPLTTLEQWLRVQAGQAAYEGDFIAYWLTKLLFFTGPPWVFIAAYSVFGALVLCSWIWLPPRRRTSMKG
jgi:hypothetical protein